MAGIRRAAKGTGRFLGEVAGETVAEMVLGLLACVLLGGLALLVYLSWSLSPRATLAGAGLLTLLLAHGAWAAYRDAGKKHRRRGVAAVTATVFTSAAVTAAFLLFYATDCGCF
ncbi:lysine transporter LysE [Streptomyces nitrosporeus]|uniref:lysine transporter LysE n=1 Tax=Streptomyces nitrosporeus TaxID=28894 RepID=UPI0039A2BF49